MKADFAVICTFEAIKERVWPFRGLVEIRSRSSSLQVIVGVTETVSTTVSDLSLVLSLLTGSPRIPATRGGREGGYGLHLRDGKPTFVYNFLSVDRPTFSAKEALPKGKTRLVVDFAYDGGGMGKGAKITISANGKKIAEGRLDRTIPIQFSLGEGVDIGRDVGSPIDFTYTMPFEFTGTIDRVTIELKPEAARSAKPKTSGGALRPKD